MLTASTHFIGSANENGNSSWFGSVMSEDGEVIVVRFVFEDTAVSEVREAIGEKLGWQQNSNGSMVRKGKGVNCLGFDVQGNLFQGEEGEMLFVVETFKIPRQTKALIEQANSMNKTSLETSGEVKW